MPLPRRGFAGYRPGDRQPREDARWPDRCSCGGDLEGRVRFPLELAASLRESWPADLPVSLRISVVDGDALGRPMAEALDDWPVQYGWWLKFRERMLGALREDTGAAAD